MSDHEGSNAAKQEQLRLSEVFDASPESIFEAFTDPAQVSRWWGPHGFDAPQERIEIDLRVGGKFSIIMVVRNPDIAAAMGVEVGAEFPDTSTIAQLEAPHLIVLRTAAQPEIGLPFESTTRIELSEEGDGRTRVTITGGPYTPEMAPNATMGWQQQLEKLGALLS